VKEEKNCGGNWRGGSPIRRKRKQTFIHYLSKSGKKGNEEEVATFIGGERGKKRGQGSMNGTFRGSYKFPRQGIRFVRNRGKIREKKRGWEVNLPAFIRLD